MANSISTSVGRFTLASSAAALMIWPDWQKPHCGTSFATQASCSALPSLVWPMPSMVVILLPAAAPSGVEQDRAACPFTCTVQAPHSAMPQPYLVPVMPRWSRRTHRRGVSRSASTDMGLPLTFRVIIEELLGKNPPQLFSALPADLCRGQVISGGKPCHRDVPAGGREPVAGADTGPLAGLASASGAKVPSRWRWRP